MGSKVKNVLKKVANVVLPNLGAAGGFTNGLIQGKGFGGALKGGLKSGINTALALAAVAAGPAVAAGAAGAGGGVGSVAQGMSGASSGLSGGGTFGSILSGAKSLAGPISSLYSGIQSTKAQGKLAKQLLEAQGRAEAVLNPYLATGQAANNRLSQSLAEGFNPGDLAQDPGYKFNLEQGTQALDRSAAARGSLFSGAAAKELQTFGQGLADNTYNTAYQRYLQKNNQDAGLAGQGFNTAQALSDVYDNQGNIRANNTLEKSNILNRTLSDLTGSGAQYTRDANGNIVDQYGRIVGRA